MDLSVACSLMPAELQERRRNVLSKVRAGVSGMTELENGFIYHFQSEGAWIPELANLIQLERQCCPFLTFRLTVEPGNGSVLLEMTGPAGTKEFLADVLGSQETKTMKPSEFCPQIGHTRGTAASAGSRKLLI